MNNIRNFHNFNVSLHNKYNVDNMEKINERIHVKMNLPQDVLDIHKIFDDAGYKLFVVGGAVRDYLMGKEPHDFDMATNATPDVTMELLKNYNADLQGAKFGIVRVFTESEPSGYEIASYRKDISKGRHTKGDDKKVEVGKHITIKDDVRRRDLTINALFYDIKTGEIVDIVGGKNDIENKIIRAVGNPNQRFIEDRLRILRTIRFAALTNSKIDERTANAIRNDNRLFGIDEESGNGRGVLETNNVSRERIFAEFVKVKDAARKHNDPNIIKRFIDLLIDFGIMEQIFPVVTKHKTIRPTTYLTVAIAQVLRDNIPDEKFNNILVEAKIPSQFVSIISILIEIYRNGITPKNVYDLYRKVSSKHVRIDILKDWFNVMNLNSKEYKKFLEYSPSTNGNMLSKQGFRGPDIGREIKRLEGEKFKLLVNESYNKVKSFDLFKK